MKKALISPNEQVSYVSGWTSKNDPIFTTIPNSSRVAEICDTSFEVAAPLFWMDCENNVAADLWYYDSVSKTILEVPPSPEPNVLPQPVVDGAQLL
jgi:hypothetical protein